MLHISLYPAVLMEKIGIWNGVEFKIIKYVLYNAQYYVPMEALADVRFKTLLHIINGLFSSSSFSGRRVVSVVGLGIFIESTSTTWHTSKSCFIFDILTSRFNYLGTGSILLLHAIFWFL